MISFALVKITGYILALYLVLLSAVPCCAFDSCPDDKAEQTESNQEEDDNCGNCSPFFNCEGCATATVNAEFVQFEFEAPVVKGAKAVYIEEQLPTIVYDFWQPPKLG